MAKQPPKRRNLDFRDFDAMLDEAERLHAQGYEKAGNWDLAQVCGHLADWLRYPVEGYPRPALLLRPVFGVIRHTIGPKALREAIRTRSTKAGVPTLRESIPPPGGDEAEALANLRRAVERFRSHAGPYQPSPMFGTIDRETAAQLQLIHGSHHLGFLIPSAVATPRDRSTTAAIETP